MAGTSRCIGGIAGDGTPLRLLTSEGANHTATSPFTIGQIWELSCTPRTNIVPPHVEDVLVTGQRFVGQQHNLHQHLLGRVHHWRGSIDTIFGGVLGYTANDNAYVSEPRGVPDQSTGFWIPDRDLVLRDDGRHYDYVYDWTRKGLSYVGEPAPIQAIPAGTLVRVSLARWWKPDNADEALEERCYLQLSGWY